MAHARSNPSGQRHLIQAHTLRPPRLPAELDGRRILLIADLHVRRPRRRYERLIEEAGRCECDLLALGGDYMDAPGDEPAAERVMRRLTEACRPRLGTVGVWGNHDSPELRRRLAPLPVTWLVNAPWRRADPPLTVLGLDCGEDEHNAPRGDLSEALAGAPPEAEPIADQPFRILLTHLPSWMPAAAERGIELMLAGHTHGGQMRGPGMNPLWNATPGWPLRFSSGLFQLGQTLGVVSRGLGESYFDGLRLFCRPHAPLLTLRQPDAPSAPTSSVQRLQRW